MSRAACEPIALPLRGCRRRASASSLGPSPWLFGAPGTSVAASVLPIPTPREFVLSSKMPLSCRDVNDVRERRRPPSLGAAGRRWLGAGAQASAEIFSCARCVKLAALDFRRVAVTARGADALVEQLVALVGLFLRSAVFGDRAPLPAELRFVWHREDFTGHAPLYASCGL